MASKMKVYLPFTLNEIKRQMAYRGAFYLFILIEMLWPFVNYYLWMAIYGSSSSDTLGSFTRNEMVVYVFMSYVASMLVMNSIAEDIMDDIMRGSVAMNLIKPIDYRTSLISKAMGRQVFQLFVPTLFVWIGLEVYKSAVLGMGVTGPVTILVFLLSCMMSFLIYVLFDFCFGMIGFYTTYFFGLSMVKQAVLTFLTGQLIPITFFPEAVRRVFDFLPFSSMVYAPVMIYLGKYQGRELGFILLRQVAWILLLYGLGSFLWGKVTKRMVILGG